MYPQLLTQCTPIRDCAMKSLPVSIDKDLSFHTVYYAEECLQADAFIAQALIGVHCVNSWGYIMIYLSSGF